MKVFPPTDTEQTNGYCYEKREYLKTMAIHTPDKLVIGKKYALATNGYYLGIYAGCEFISHIPQGWTCKCHGNIYKFIKVNSIESRGLYCIETLGVYEITD